MVLLDFGAGLNFFQDEWPFMLDRRGFTAGAFLTPHNEHIVVIPSAVYKVLLGAFGMTSTAPFRVVATLVLAATAVLVFAYLRRRIGDWLALFAAVLILFLGPAWEVLLWPFEMGLVASLASGIAMLMALERGDRTGDRRACALLTVSTLCSSLGLAFIVAAAVEVAWRRADWRRRALIPAIPLAIYAVWYAAYGHEGPSNVSLDNIVASPVYLLNGLASSFDSLLGLLPANSLQEAHPRWGWAILAVVVVLAAARLRRRGRPSPQLLAVVAAVAAFWLLAGANFTPGRAATESRYQYVGVVLLLLLLAEVFRGVRPARWTIVAGLAVSVLALVANLDTLQDGRDFFREQTDLSRAELGAIEIARGTVAPAFALTPDVAGTPFLSAVEAGPYLSAVDAYGSPADDPRQLAAAPAPDRASADVVLASALPVSLASGSAGAAPAGPAPVVPDAPGPGPRAGCATVPGSLARAGADVELRGARTAIRAAPGGAATLRLRRFATGPFPYRVGSVAGGTSAVLTIPADRSPRPWRLEVRAPGSVRLCGAGP